LIDALLREQSGIEEHKARWGRWVGWLVMFVSGCAITATLRIGAVFGFEIAILGVMSLCCLVFMSAVSGIVVCGGCRCPVRSSTMAVSMLICASTVSISFLVFPLAWFYSKPPQDVRWLNEARFEDAYIVGAVCFAVGTIWTLTRYALGLTPHRKRQAGWFLALTGAYVGISLCSMYAWWLGLLLLGD